MTQTRRPLTRRTLSWVERSLGRGARVAGASPLIGGLTADMDRLRIAGASGAYEIVLRRWSDDPHRWGPGLVERESAALCVLADHAMPAPRLLAADPTGDEAGLPSLLMSAVPGEPLLVPPDLDACVRQMARMLVRLHDLPATLDWSDPYGLDPDADRSWIGDPALADAALAAAAEPDDDRHVFLHGDYQQLNILWSRGRLSGVVDWTYAGSGLAGVDVGHCRLALAVFFSAAAADSFLACYEAEAGRRVDPHTDIRGLLAFGYGWLSFVPRQVAGRAMLDVPGMAGRVTAVLRTAVLRTGHTSVPATTTASRGSTTSTSVRTADDEVPAPRCWRPSRTGRRSV